MKFNERLGTTEPQVPTKEGSLQHNLELLSSLNHRIANATGEVDRIARFVHGYREQQTMTPGPDLKEVSTINLQGEVRALLVQIEQLEAALRVLENGY